MKKFGLQLWSIRDSFTNEEDTRDAFRKISEMGYTSAQTAGTYDYIAPEKFAEYAHQYGIELFSTHYDYEKIKNDIEGTVKYHNAIGAKYIGIGGAHIFTREQLDEFIGDYNRLARIYADYGFKLTYHNHSREFGKLDGKVIFDRLIDEIDAENFSFCLDTYWAQYSGINVCGLIERLAGRVDIIHLKDMTPWVPFELKDGSIHYAPEMIEVGEGNMDFASIIKTAEKSGTKHFIVEDEFYSTGDPMESVKISADNIKKKFIEK